MLENMLIHFFGELDELLLEASKLSFAQRADNRLASR